MISRLENLAPGSFFNDDNDQDLKSTLEIKRDLGNHLHDVPHHHVDHGHRQADLHHPHGGHIGHLEPTDDPMIIDMGSIELGPGETAAATTASFGGQSRSILSFFEPKRTPTGLPLIGRLRGTGLVPPPPQAGPLPPPAPPFTPSPTVPQQPARLTSFVHGALLKQDNPRPAQPATSSGLPFKYGIYFEPPVPRQPF